MDDEPEDQRLNAALDGLVASEVRRARIDIQARQGDSATSQARRARRFGMPGVAIRGLAVGIAVLVAIGGGYALVSLRSSTVSSPKGPTIEGRYPDGIPMRLNGQPVLRGTAAVAAARASVDSTPFMVGVWASTPVTGSAGDRNPTFADPQGLWPDLGDAPGFLGEPVSMLRYYHNMPGFFGVPLPAASLPASFFNPGAHLDPGPVVVRVHTHDPLADTCDPKDLDMCMHLMVPEAVLWDGDSTTDPRPISVKQVAAAFKVPAKPLDEESIYVCGELPGVVELAFGDNSEGLVEVFPSVDAARHYAPIAAAVGESSAPPGPISAGECADNLRWFVRANIVVEVRYDPTLGVDADPWIEFTRKALGHLPY